MERKGVLFEIGYPHFYEGVNYCWPNRDKDYDALFLDKRDELGEVLIENLKRYISDFGVCASVPPYPNLQKGEKGLALHLGDGGRWIELWKMLGSHFINGHNLDSWIDKAAAFNIGSDVLEYLSPEILAPRIMKKGGKWSMRYPLPDGVDRIEHELFSEESLRNVYELVDFDPDIRITDENNLQKIVNSNGEIVIENDFCKGRNFESWDVAKSSFVIARVMLLSDLC